MAETKREGEETGGEGGDGGRETNRQHIAIFIMVEAQYLSLTTNLAGASVCDGQGADTDPSQCSQMRTLVYRQEF